MDRSAKNELPFIMTGSWNPIEKMSAEGFTKSQVDYGKQQNPNSHEVAEGFSRFVDKTLGSSRTPTVLGRQKDSKSLYKRLLEAVKGDK